MKKENSSEIRARMLNRQQQFLTWLRLLRIAVAVLMAMAALANPFAPSAAAQTESTANTAEASPCPSLPMAPALSLKCTLFEGHLYAVVDVNLRSHRIVFTTSEDGRAETYPVVVNNLYKANLKPVLVTNGGIYGTDNRPMGLLITPTGKKHDVDIRKGHGNFSWDSAVFQILDNGTASIVAARHWQDSPHTIAATQSGPQLVSLGKINPGFPPQSKWSFLRTAIGVDRSNKRIVHLVVSRDAVTLFELATFMVNELHCADALHLDGGLSAFYIPSSQGKFIFSDPGERIVTVLSVVPRQSLK